MYNRQRDRRMVVSTTRRNDEIEIISRVGVECINSERKKNDMKIMMNARDRILPDMNK